MRSSQRSKEGKKKGHKTILDRFLNSPRCRQSQSAIGWDEDLCSVYATAAEDHSYIATQAERRRNENSGKLVLNTSGRKGPTDQRDDDQEARRTHERLYEEHGKGNTRLHPKDQVRQRRRQQFVATEERSECVHPKTGWRWQVLHLHVGKQLLECAIIFYNGLKVFSLTGNDGSLVSDGGCTQDTKPARNVTFPHTCFFSRGVP